MFAAGKNSQSNLALWIQPQDPHSKHFIFTYQWIQAPRVFYYTVLERLVGNKQSSFRNQFVNYEEIKCCEYCSSYQPCLLESVEVCLCFITMVTVFNANVQVARVFYYTVLERLVSNKHSSLTDQFNANVYIETNQEKTEIYWMPWKWKMRIGKQSAARWWSLFWQGQGFNPVTSNLKAIGKSTESNEKHTKVSTSN